VDDTDFVAFASAYNELLCPLFCFDELICEKQVFCPADFNDDWFVDDADFVLFAEAYDNLVCE
jgi:hypothetical protein